ncbi:hypothetical protein GA0070615_4293 [Micromonospora aurantiaca]|nr:hypothetical protein GA0070615_4293 [Micromonospora aurantiaca]
MLSGLNPGDRLTRREVHARFGGRRQGGISPSREAPVVMFFTDPRTGHQHGYYDGWDEHGLLNYVGEGQQGDQKFTQGNKSILLHKEEGRTLEGFLANGPVVTYLGEFELVDTYLRDAHETGNEDALRQVIVFRLRPRNEVPVELPSTPITPTAAPVVNTVPVEEQHTERSFITPNREPYELERIEATLVRRYRNFLQSQGHAVGRLRIVPPGEGSPLYSDLWDETTRELVEAKGSVTRDQLRQAVGQLLDYGRFVDASVRSVLVPSRPRGDLLDYLRHAGVGVIYPDGDRWVRE